MPEVIKLERLGKNMESATVAELMVKTGDDIQAGDKIAAVETDKATVEVESPAGGNIWEILVSADQTIKVDCPLMIISSEGEVVEPEFIEKNRALVKEMTVEVSAGAVKPDTEVGGSDETFDNSEVSGERVAISSVQKIVGEKMLVSKLNIPCFYLNIIADVTELMKVRKDLNKKSSVKISINDMVIKALALGLEHYPVMTGQIYGENIVLAEELNVGLAVAVEGGLAAPTCKNVDKKNLEQIARDNAEMIERARAGKLTTEDLEPGCITVSNLGAYGIDSFIPIVIPGQCSILGVGKITETPMPIDGNIIVRELMNMNLSVDHKVANGADAAQFFDFVKKKLENPQSLL